MGQCITDEWVCVTKEEIEVVTNTRIMMVEYFRFRTAIRSIEQVYRTEHTRPRTIISFLRSIKKGCNKIRTFLDGVKSVK